MSLLLTELQSRPLFLRGRGRVRTIVNSLKAIVVFEHSTVAKMSEEVHFQGELIRGSAPFQLGSDFFIYEPILIKIAQYI